jgi:anti-sigma factor RsiW
MHHSWAEGKKMTETHIHESDIEEYVSGILNEKERREVEAHAYQCTECLRSLMVSALSLRVHQRIRDLLLEDDHTTAALV